MVSLFGFGSSSTPAQDGGASSSSSSSTLSSRSPSPGTATDLVVPATPAADAAVATAVNPLNPKGLKPCCACPETKSARDECFLKSSPGEGEENCKTFIEAHKACMRGYGFKV